MFEIFAQARFPKPEFTSGYVYPDMGLETWYFSQDYLKLGVYALLIVAAGFALYKMRSKKLLALLSLLSVCLLGFYWKGCPCPIGLTQNTAAFLFYENAHYPFVYFAIFALPIIAALFFGRIFCGGVCPLGALQELLFFKRVKVNATLDLTLRLLPYFVLAVAIVFASVGGTFFACAYDPFVPLFRRAGTLPLAVFCGLMLILSVFISRPYCKYLCPYSVLLKFASYLSSRRVKIAPKRCVNCKLCEGLCPNDAIVVPETGKIFETPDVVKSRIQKLLIFSPFIILGGAVAGWAFGIVISDYYPTMLLLRDVERGVSNVDTDAFLSSGVSISDLRALVEHTRWKLYVGFAIAGATLAGLSLIEILRLSRRRQNREFEVDMGKCLCCGRCYEACPDEVLRKKGISK